MKLLTRPLGFIVVATVSALVLSGLLVAGSILAAPPVTVSIQDHEQGLRIWIPVPSLWLTTAARLAPLDRLLQQLDDEKLSILADAADLVDRLTEVQNAVLVRVDSGSELVVVRKVDRRFLVSVQSPEADIDVRVPASTVRALARQLPS